MPREDSSPFPAPIRNVSQYFKRTWARGQDFHVGVHVRYGAKNGMNHPSQVLRTVLLQYVLRATAGGAEKSFRDFAPNAWLVGIETGPVKIGGNYGWNAGSLVLRGLNKCQIIVCIMIMNFCYGV